LVAFVQDVPQTAKGRILVIEDSSSQAQELLGTLERLGYVVLWARSGMEGLLKAQSEHPDVILLDVVLSDMDGFAVCRWLKMRPETRDTPVLMLSVQGATEQRIQGLLVGANDYILKSCPAEELEARIFAALRIKATHAELRERNNQLEAMLHRVEALAITDALTGLYNRRRFADVLKNQFAVTKRYKNPLSCMMVDVDHFKQINDRYGHDVGDRVLQVVAQKIGENLREVDLAARYGGEEFAILLPHTAKNNAVVVAERILRVVRGLEVPATPTPIRLTASVGIAASTDLSAGAAPDDLVKAADSALYQAKAKGRDRVELYDAGPQPKE
jgi:diguanylate cyclase (GGDEF)-like protein